MSVAGGSPPPVDGLVDEVIQQLNHRTPTPQLDDDTKKSSTKEQCAHMKDQKWGLVTQEQREQKRRQHIQRPEYWRSLVTWKLEVLLKFMSSVELPQLLQMTDQLDKIVSDIGLSGYDVEDVPFGVPQTNTLLWDEEYSFWQSVKEERQQFFQRQREARQPASARTSSSPEQPAVPAPRSNSHGPPSSKVVLAANAKVKKNRSKNKVSPQRRPMTRAFAASKKQRVHRRTKIKPK